MDFEGVMREIEELNKRGEYWCVPRDVGEFLKELVIKLDAKNVVEIGTSLGYSSLWMADGMRELDERGGGVDGDESFGIERKVYTVESHAERFLLGEGFFARSGMNKYIVHIKSHAPEVFEEFDFSSGVDLGFVDAIKKESIVYFKEMKKLVRKGGVIVVDNVTTHWGEMERFIEYLEDEGERFTIRRDLGSGPVVVWVGE